MYIYIYSLLFCKSLVEVSFSIAKLFYVFSHQISIKRSPLPVYPTLGFVYLKSFLESSFKTFRPLEQFLCFVWYYIRNLQDRLVISQKEVGEKETAFYLLILLLQTHGLPSVKSELENPSSHALILPNFRN